MKTVLSTRRKSSPGHNPLHGYEQLTPAKRPRKQKVVAWNCRHNIERKLDPLTDASFCGFGPQVKPSR
jgi:hypothetical protein